MSKAEKEGDKEQKEELERRAEVREKEKGSTAGNLDRQRQEKGRESES